MRSFGDSEWNCILQLEQIITASCILSAKYELPLRRYQKSSRCEKMGYEQDFVKYLQSIMSEVDRRIKRGLSRLAMNAAATVNTS